jgi:hypothetical protein
MRPSDVKAAVVTAVVAVGVVVAVVVASAHSSHEPKVFEERTTPPAPDSDSSTDADVTVMDLDEPIVCMVNLDCLLDAVHVSSEAPIPYPVPVPPTPIPDPVPVPPTPVPPAVIDDT